MNGSKKLHSKIEYVDDESLKADNSDRFIQFGLLGETIIQTLPLGAVFFDRDLKIIKANSQARKIIEISDYIDKSLAKGTEYHNTPGVNWTEQLKDTLTKKDIHIFDSISYKFNGRTKLLQIICTPLQTTKTHRIVGGSILIEDITEKVSIQKQLANTERLAIIGKHASKIAHELSGPIDGILRYINLTSRIIEQEELEKPKEYLDRCRQGLMRMIQIVSELLEFSRGTQASFEYAPIEHIIEDAINSIHIKAEDSNIHILRNYVSSIPQIKSGNLFQVFYNIIKNAFEAMATGGELHISTHLTANKIVQVEFHDTGIGFAPENAEIIFEPFFTTKEKGTGLGLAICKDIIERRNGQITAENAPQMGSIFTVFLPLESNS